MTSIATAETTSGTPAGAWNRSLLALTAAMATLTVVALVGLVADGREVLASPVWLKPFKFAVSFTIYAGTLAWMLTLLPRRSRTAEWAAVILVAASVIEVGAVVVQAARGVPSHYNETTAFNALMWQAMAGASVVLFIGQLMLAFVVLRARIDDRAAATAIRLGLAVSAIGMLVAMPMVLPNLFPVTAGAHTVGAGDGGPGLPLVGWSTQGGDLRIGHFIGLHALQALPLLALLLTRYARPLRERTTVRLLRVAGAAYAAVTLLFTAQALRGQSIVAPDLLTILSFGLVAAASVATALLFLARNRTA